MPFTDVDETLSTWPGLSALIFPICKIEIIVPTSFYSVMINRILPMRPGCLVTLIVGRSITIVVAAVITITIIILITIYYHNTSKSDKPKPLNIFLGNCRDIWHLSRRGTKIKC